MSNWRYLAAAGGRGTAVLDERAARTAHKTSSNLETAVPSGRRRRVAAGDERKEGPPKLAARRRPEFRQVQIARKNRNSNEETARTATRRPPTGARGKRRKIWFGDFRLRPQGRREPARSTSLGQHFAAFGGESGQMAIAQTGATVAKVNLYHLHSLKSARS